MWEWKIKMEFKKQKQQSVPPMILINSQSLEKIVLQADSTTACHQQYNFKREVVTLVHS